MKKALNLIYYSALVFFGLIALVLTVSILPITGNVKFMIVRSGSMAPVVDSGDLVVVKPLSDYELGDIITFYYSDLSKLTVTHRIYEVNQEGVSESYITKGDANNSPDQRPIPKDQIIGKVLLSVPYLGYAVDAAKKPLGFLLIFVIPASIIVVDEVRKIIKEIFKLKKAKYAGNQASKKNI